MVPTAVCVRRMSRLKSLNSRQNTKLSRVEAFLWSRGRSRRSRKVPNLIFRKTVRLLGASYVVAPLLSRPSVRGVPQLHGSMTLVERRRTIYFRAENSNVAEQERYKGLRICSSRSDSAAHHEKSRCASSQHQLRSPALSVPDVPASQASSEVDVRRRSTSPSTTR